MSEIPRSHGDPDQGPPGSGPPDAEPPIEPLPPPDTPIPAESARAFGAAETLTGGLIGLGLLGYLLDLRFGSSPAFLLSGIGLGLVVGFYQLYKFMLGRTGSPRAGRRPRPGPGRDGRQDGSGGGAGPA